jgi:membrane glycosyltransferase
VAEVIQAQPKAATLCLLLLQALAVAATPPAGTPAPMERLVEVAAEVKSSEEVPEVEEVELLVKVTTVVAQMVKGLVLRLAVVEVLVVLAVLLAKGVAIVQFLVLMVLVCILLLLALQFIGLMAKAVERLLQA